MKTRRDSDSLYKTFSIIFTRLKRIALLIDADTNLAKYRKTDFVEETLTRIFDIIEELNEAGDVGLRIYRDRSSLSMVLNRIFYYVTRLGALWNLPQWLKDKFLFLGYTSKIADGKLLNEVGSDWLNVVGTSYQIPTQLGAELVTNNTFDNNSFWSLYEGTISGGVAVYNNVGASRGFYKANLLTAGQYYQVQYEIKNYVSGSFNLNDAGATYGVNRKANGVYSEIFKPTSHYIMFYSGEAGSTFNVDNVSIKEITALSAYLAADTDRLWYSDDLLTNRLVTTDELQRYDWGRAIVKYGNVSPFNVSIIGILKTDATFTTAEENTMRDMFDLSVWWSGTLSSHGKVKGNRVAEKSDGTELITDGEFTSGASWISDAGIYDYGGSFVCNKTSVGGTHKTIAPSPFTVGKTYRVIYEIKKYTSGTIRFILGWTGVYGTYRSAVGIFIEDVTIPANPGNEPGRVDFRTDAAGFVGVIDHFSIRAL